MRHPFAFTAPIGSRLARFLFLLLGITVAGTVGFMTLENWQWHEALYMTVITLSTVGFAEVRPLSPEGRVFTTILIAGGVVSVTYLFSSISQYIVSGELTGSLGRARMQRAIEHLTGHYIVCGHGRVGQQVVEDLEERGHRTVVIEERLPEGDDRRVGHLIVDGDAADDDVLVRAGIKRACGLVAATGDDATNLFITISANALNERLIIVARANEPASEPKLLRAGASHVISPYTLSGRRIATQLLYPSITDFLDVVMHSGNLELWLEECPVNVDSALNQKTVGELDLRETTGANVLAIRRNGDGDMLTDLRRDMRLDPGDVMIALGTRDQLQALRELAGK